MEFYYLIGAALTAWVTLSMIGNERQTRIHEIERAAEKAAREKAKAAAIQADNEPIEVS